MTTVSDDVHLNQIFTDAKYGVDVVVEYINDNIVLLMEEESGNKRLCGREEFSEETNRFLPKND